MEHETTLLFKKAEEKDMLEDTDMLSEEQKRVERTVRENIILRKAMACVIVISVILAMLMFFQRQDHNQGTNENATSNEYTKLEHFLNNQAEQEMLSNQLNRVNLRKENLNFELGHEGSYTFHSIHVIDEFTLNYNESTVAVTAELRIDYRFNSSDINLFNQVVNEQNTIIVKPNYRNMVTCVNLITFVSDYDFESDNERQALALRVIDEASRIYELSDEELDNRLSLFFKDHFFFINDVYSIAIISRQSEEIGG